MQLCMFITSKALNRSMSMKQYSSKVAYYLLEKDKKRYIVATRYDNLLMLIAPSLYLFYQFPFCARFLMKINSWRFLMPMAALTYGKMTLLLYILFSIIAKAWVYYEGPRLILHHMLTDLQFKVIGVYDNKKQAEMMYVLL